MKLTIQITEGEKTIALRIEPTAEVPRKPPQPETRRTGIALVSKREKLA